MKMIHVQVVVFVEKKCVYGFFLMLYDFRSHSSFDFVQDAHPV